MSSELERRLEGFLGELPEADAEVGERALVAAVGVLRPSPPSRRALRTGALVFAAAVVLLSIAAGSLAAAGALHVSFGHKTKPTSRVTQLRLPSGTAGIDVVVNGRLSLVTKTGFRLQGLGVSAAALSPHALFVAAGIGHSLVAMAPDGRRAWTHPAAGSVVEIAWAPFGNRIAYVVHTGRRDVLHVIWGDGTNDAVIDRSVRAVRPSWRADSLAVAYVGAGGRPVVYDVGHQEHRLAAVRAPVSGLAFAPVGDRLAVDGGDGLWLARGDSALRVPVGAVEAFGWERDGRLAVAVPGRTTAVLRRFTSGGVPRGESPVRGIVVAVTPKLVVVRRGNALVAGDTTLLTVPAGASVAAVEIG